MHKSVLFLADGMADEPLEELGGKTPLEIADTPYMDLLAKKGASGTFLSLPDGFPTSSDVANMSVMGYELAECYPGRGPIEAVSQDIDLADDDIAWRCNLVSVVDDILTDYSAGHIDDKVSRQIMLDLQEEFGNDKLSFFPGVGYRNLLVLHGEEFSSNIKYFKPDSTQGENVADIWLIPEDDSPEAVHTVAFLTELMKKANAFLEEHSLNKSINNAANYIWPWSPGYRPCFIPFSEKYAGHTGAVISAVDVINGIAKCAKMDVIKVPGVTGFIDTNYDGKAQGAIKALDDHDFVYLHVEAIDECSHMGDLKLKIQAIEDFDSKIIAPVYEALKDQNVSMALLPDHPVPIKLRKHTRTPVPFTICGSNITPDYIEVYSETEAPKGALGRLQGDELMKMILMTS